MQLFTIFKNGGSNYSFGRGFAGLVIVMGMTTLCLGIKSDYNNAIHPVQMSKYDTETKVSYQETQLVAKPDWSGYQTFMIGIATLAGAVYGLSKFGDAAHKFAGGNGEGG